MTKILFTNLSPVNLQLYLHMPLSGGTIYAPTSNAGRIVLCESKTIADDSHDGISFEPGETAKFSGQFDLSRWFASAEVEGDSINIINNAVFDFANKTQEESSLELDRYLLAKPASKILYPIIGSCEHNDFVQAAASVGYFAYIGRFDKDEIITNLRVHVVTGGSGSQTAEMGIFTSEDYPRYNNVDLTCVAANASIDSLTSTGAKAAVGGILYAVSRGQHIWAGFRTVMGTTYPRMLGCAPHIGSALILSTSSATAVAVDNAYTGAVIVASTSPVAPYFSVELA